MTASQEQALEDAMLLFRITDWAFDNGLPDHLWPADDAWPRIAQLMGRGVHTAGEFKGDA